MKFYRRIWVREQGFPPALYKRIVQLKPECLEGDHFRLECQPGDEAAATLAKHIVEMCDQYGLRQSAGGDIGTLGYDVNIHFEPEELRSAPFLRLLPQKRMFRDGHSFQRDEHGRLLLPASTAKPTIQIASGFLTNWFVVSDAVRSLLEPPRFVGIEFIETKLFGKSVHAATTPFWELSSSLSLPKMVNSARNEHSAIPFYSVHEPPYRNPPPRYRQTDLLPIGRFDLARTWEPMTGGPGLIISQRFYQHCLKHKIPLEVEPVRIDPD